MSLPVRSRRGERRDTTGTEEKQATFVWVYEGSTDRWVHKFENWPNTLSCTYELSCSYNEQKQQPSTWITVFQAKFFHDCCEASQTSSISHRCTLVIQQTAIWNSFEISNREPRLLQIRRILRKLYSINISGTSLCVHQNTCIFAKAQCFFFIYENIKFYIKIHNSYRDTAFLIVLNL